MIVIGDAFVVASALASLFLPLIRIFGISGYTVEILTSGMVVLSMILWSFRCVALKRERAKKAKDGKFSPASCWFCFTLVAASAALFCWMTIAYVIRKGHFTTMLVFTNSLVRLICVSSVIHSTVSSHWFEWLFWATWVFFMITNVDNLAASSRPLDIETAIRAIDVTVNAYDKYASEGIDRTIVKNIGGKKYFSFASTVTLEDVYSDLDVTGTNVPEEWGFPKGVRIHRGFMKVYNKYRSKVLTFGENNDEAVFCGHSLGGALIQIAALDVAINRKKKFDVYTFGSPRVGNSKFVKAYNSQVNKSYRIYKPFDPIVFPGLINYKHAKKSIPISSRWYITDLDPHSSTSYRSLLEQRADDPFVDYVANASLNTLVALVYTVITGALRSVRNASQRAP